MTKFKLNFMAYMDIANIMTTINVLLSMAIVYFAFIDELLICSLILCFSTILDFLDGYIARTYYSHRTENRIFGKSLDSLSDLLNFSVAPAIVILIASNSSLAMLSAVTLVVSGVLRLSAFSVYSESSNGLYSGLPTTYAGFIISLCLLAANYIESIINIIPYIYIIVAIGQVATFKIRKMPAISTVSFISITYISIFSVFLFNW